MEVVNIIFEKYGGGQVARIFKTYLILALVLKELMISLFVIPEDRSVIDPAPGNNTSIFEVENTAEADISTPGILQLMPLLIRNAAESISVSQFFRSPNPLPQHENI